MTDLKILIANNAPALQAASPDVTVEAEFGDAVVTGTMLTMAHHGPRTGQPAPCSYSNGCAPSVRTIGLSHVDLDTIGGVLAALGRKPMGGLGFWRLAEFVDLNGAHKLGQSGASAGDLRRLNAYWAFSRGVRVYAPRDGTVADVTADVLKHVEAVEKILGCDETMLLAGDEFAKGEADLNAKTFVSIERGVILRRSTSFANHLYTTPDGQIAKAVVSWNPGPDLSGGAITASLADPVPGLSCGETLKALFGPEAGGHAGIGGSPRGKALPESDALLVVEALAKGLG
jgi:hypothetical protein